MDRIRLGSISQGLTASVVAVVGFDSVSVVACSQLMVAGFVGASGFCPKQRGLIYV